MSDSTKKRALALRNFKNEGTGENVKKDTTLLLDAGTYANYLAAGLISEKVPEKAAKVEAEPRFAADKP